MKNFKLMYLSIFILVSSLFTAYMYHQREMHIEKILTNTSKELSFNYKSIYQKKKFFSTFIYEYSIQEQVQVMKLLYDIQDASKSKKDAIRTTLFKYFKEEYKDIQKIAFGKQLHFHLPNNESFLRMHRPKKYGDNLTTSRETVEYVNKYKKPVDGFEEGKIFNGFRFVYPLSYKGVHIGSVEMSYRAYTIINDAVKDMDVFANFIISKEIVDKKVFADEKKNYLDSGFKGYYFDRSVLDKIESIFDKDNHQSDISMTLRDRISKDIPKGKVLSYYDKTLKKIITILPQQNPITKKYIASYIIRSDSPELVHEIKHFYVISSLVTALLAFIFLVLCVKSEAKLKQKMKDDQIKAFFNALPIISIVSDGKEIISVNNQFFDFFKQFKSLEDLKQKHTSICNLFEVVDSDDYLIQKTEDNSRWIQKVIGDSVIDYKVCLKKDGHYHHFNIKVKKIISYDGKPLYIISLLDITKEVTINKNMQKVINYQDNMLIILDKNLKLSFANDKFLRLFNVPSINKFHNKFLHVNDIFTKKEGYFFSENSDEWVYELARVDILNKIVFISGRVFLVNLSFLRDAGTWICTFTEYTQHAKEKQVLSKKVYTDELTGICNRAKFNEVIQREMNYFIKYGSSFSMVIADIDFFKNINDEYGHDIGDTILKEITLLTRAHIRENDFFARWGGEEFVLLFHKTTEHSAKKIVEGLRAKIEDATFNNAIKLTCSFGIATVLPKEKEDELFKRVDNALYDAKNSGRNCVKVSK